MCGIAGVLSRTSNIDRELLKRMTDPLAHRGPDGDGFWISADRNVGLGHRRLAIIDLSDTGRQPMSFADGRYQITYNGEIYNYLELRADLEKRGHRFVSTSDTEVLLALFSEKKEECLGYLDGMFAFAIWDEKEKRLFAARDRFGEKPFYYIRENGSFYFASEMKSFWAVGLARSVDQQMLYRYLAEGFTYDPDDLSRTFFESVYKLKAGHFFYVAENDDQLEQKRYWDLDPLALNNEVSDDDAEAKFRQLFDESVRRRLRSDVPVGSSLSGGLDSSLVVGTIDRLNAEKKIRQATFSARFPGFEKDEGRYMQAVIDRTNVEPHFVFPDDRGLAGDLEKLFHHQEEPFGTASIYAQFSVMRLALEKGIIVLLDGQGADELLAGYHPFFDDYLRELSSAGSKTRISEQQAHQAIYGRPAGGRKVKQSLASFLPAQMIGQARQIRSRLRTRFGSIINREFSRANSDKPFPYQPPAASLNDSLYRHTLGGPLEELLRYADRNAMANSVEVRLPFLSHELAEFLFSLPPHFKIRNGVHKYIMRAAFKDVLPPEIATRTDKIGYEPPQQAWLENRGVTEMINEATKLLISEKVLSEDASKKIADDDSKTDIFSSVKWKMLMAGKLLQR